MHRKHHIGIAVGGENVGGVIAHSALPILPPGRAVHHQHMGDAAVTQGGNSGFGIVHIGCGGGLVAEGFVGNIDYHIVFFAVDGGTDVVA